MTRRRGVAFLAGAGLLLGGCGDGDDLEQSTPDAATPSPTVEPTATPPPRAALGPVIWCTAIAPNGEPEDQVETLPRDAPVIYAAVEAETLVAGERLTATWSINGAPIESIDTAVTIEDAAAAGWVSFSLTWQGEALWPVGQLEVTISASSGATTSGAIQIVSNQ